MKLAITAIFLALIFPSASVASDGKAGALELVLANLSGSSVDFSNGQLKTGSTSMKGPLTITVSDSKNATLDTGIVTLNGYLLGVVGEQVSFYFEAEKAVWTITCYSRFGIGFVAVHSDASEYGGARSLNLHGACELREAN